MAIIGMRDLLRDPKQVFKHVEQDGELTVVTRNGRPIAALIPVDSENAERLLLGATPEYSASRRETEHASAEGRTRSLDEAIAEYNARHDTTEPIEPNEEAEAPGLLTFLEADPSSSEIGPVVTLVRSMFGELSAEHIATEAADRVSTINRRAISAANDAGLPADESDEAHEFVSTIQQGNQQLFARVLFESLRDTLTRRLSGANSRELFTTALEAVGPGRFAQVVLQETLDDTTERVQMLNGAALQLGLQVGKGQISLQTYGAVVRGAELFERVVQSGAERPATLGS